ncbi:MAG TPA: peptide-methionine (S)-S-oxide reductase MsrA [Candidatus Thermoplasmatota archaeon]|nr:peptide-methionine (S)-S-oxide reductase MsrA [Candidatus Thermoplasmatota archaeon]
MTGKGTETATLGGGCFWCVEAVFEQVQGVEKVVSGYAGGTVEDPDYESVCAGRTGHAEVVQVTFDPARVSYGDLLRVFFSVHDPTTLNRQGADVGTQYRSIILYHSEEQKRVAEEVLREVDAEGAWGAKAVTQIVPLTRFYAAEDYHQGYYRRNPYQGYCMMVIRPKVAKFRQKYAHLLKVPA